MFLPSDKLPIRTRHRTRHTAGRRRPLTVELCERRDMLVGNFLDGVSLGDVLANAIDEASGLVASQQNTDVFWTHNDSGDSNRVFGLNAQGDFLGSFVLQGAAANDYEDIAIGKGPQSGVSYMYIADTGDNDENRADIDIYRVPEPSVNAAGGDQSTTMTGVDTITLTYPDGAHDAEALLSDPLSGDLYLVTKRDSLNRVYRAPAPGPGDQTIALEFKGEMDWTWALGGDVSSNGLEIILKSDTTVYVYDRPFGTELSDALLSPVNVVNPPYTAEPQGEAIAFDADGEHYFTLSESVGQSSQPLLFYQRDSGGATVTHEFQDGVLPDANYASTRDVEIRQDQPDTNFGGAVSITIDGDDPSSSSQDTSALLRWDVTNLSAGAAVQSATITFEAFDPTNNSYTIYESLRNWVEGETTWNEFATGQSWQTPGAAGALDRGSTSLGTLSNTGTGAVNVNLNANGVAVVQQWIDNPLSNNGVVIANAAATDGFDFHSREAASAITHPKLSVVIGDQTSITPQFDIQHTPRLQLGDAPLVGFAGSATDQAHVIWQTMPAGSGIDDRFTVQYRAVGDALWENLTLPSTIDTGASGRVNHFVDITNLRYDQAFEYRVRHLRAGNILATYQNGFQTRLSAGDNAPFQFVAYGDSAYTPNIQNFRNVQDRVNQIDPAFAVLLGDNVYDSGTHAELDARFDPTLNPEAAAWNSGHIDYLGVGNHDVGSASGQQTEDNFAVPIPVAGLTAPAEPPAGERPEHNYSFDYGLVHFVTFDTNSLSNATRLDNQLSYVEADLAASSAPWKIVFGHHPVAGVPDKSQGPSDNYYQQVVSRLRAAGADLFMVGHSHTYSWTYPLLGESNGEATFVLDTDKDYQKGDGLVQVVSGVGGRSLRSGSYSQFPFVAAGFTTDTSTAVEDGVALIDVTPGQLTVSYVAADDGAIIDEFTITAGINTPPVATDDSYSVDEDAILNVAAPGLLGNDSDADSDPMTAVLQAGPSDGILSLNSDGSFSYTPDTDFNGVDAFTYRANDGLANSNLATVTLTINPINDLPTAFDDGFSTEKNSTLTVSAPGVLSNDVDVDGDPLTAALVDNVTNGTLTLNADGSFDYTPDLDFVGNDSFTYTANDGMGDSNVVTVTITVSLVGGLDHVVAETLRFGIVTGSYEDTEDSDETYESIQEDVYAGGKRSRLELTWEAIVTGGSLVKFVLEGHRDAGAVDAFAFDYSVDNSNWTNMFTVTSDVDIVHEFELPAGTSGQVFIRVLDTDRNRNEGTADTIFVDHMYFLSSDGSPNSIPLASNDGYSIDEDVTLNVSTPGILSNDTDGDGDPLTAVLDSGPTNGSLTLNADGSFSYAPDSDFNGADTFTYRANDGNDDSNVATVTITVNAVNDAPVANNDAVATGEDVAVNIDVLLNDTHVDGTLVVNSVTVTVGPTIGTAIANADGTVTYTPAASFAGVETFDYTVMDDTGAVSNAATVTVTVNSTAGTKFFVVDDESNETFEYGASGQFLEQTGLDTGNVEPRGVTSNATGSLVWVVDAGGTVFVYDGDGTPQGSWTADAVKGAEGIATDGTDIWIVDGGSKKLLYYQGAATLSSGSMRPTSRTRLGSQSNVKGVTTDGTSLWIVNDGATTDTVLKYTTDVTLLGSWVIDGPDTTPTGITINPAGGDDLWIVDAGSNAIFEFTEGALRIDNIQLAAYVYALDSLNANPQGIADPMPRGSDSIASVTNYVNAAVISTARPRSDVMSYEVSVAEAVAQATLPNAWVAGFAQAHMAAGDDARRSEFQTTLKPFAPEDSITASPIGPSSPRLVDIVLSRHYGDQRSNQKFGEVRTNSLVNEIADEVFNELDDRW